MRHSTHKWAGFRWLLLMVVVAIAGATIGVVPAVAADEPWIHVAELADPDGVALDNFGLSVAAEDDTIVVGAHRDDGSGTDRGAVHVFSRDPSTGVWEHEQELTDPNAADVDHFGWSVAINGGRIVIGANLADGSGDDRGAAHVFSRDLSTGAWEHDQQLADPTSADYDQFGSSVAIDGDRIVVGADHDDGTTGDHGAVHVFSRDPSTGVWGHVQELTDPSGALADWLGSSVAIAGARIVAGAQYDDGAGTNRGAAHVFSRDLSTGVWEHDQELTNPIAADSNQFGWSVAIDGDRVVIGNRGIYREDQSAHVFSRDPSTGDWGHDQRLTNPAVEDVLAFSTSVAILGDRIVVGDSGDNGGVDRAGAAHVFNRDSTTGVWAYAQRLADPNSAPLDQFGISVVVDGDRIVVGAFNQAAAGSNRGAVHVFELDVVPPDVSIVTPVDDASFELGTVVAADFACSDVGSGIASCVGTVADGAALDTSTAGPHSLSVTAIDVAGNTTTVTHDYTVNPVPPVNEAPLVSAGSDVSVVLPNGAALDGTVTDDGLPSGSLSSEWAMLSGPGTVTFGDAAVVDTSAGFSTDGTYVLRLTATDGVLMDFDDVTITVDPAPPPHQDTAHFAVAISDDQHVFGGGWLPEVDVTVTLDSVANGPGDPYTGVFTPDGDGVWGSPQQAWPLAPGDVVTASDGQVTKVHVVAPLTMSIDPIADTVSGTSTPGADISVLIEHEHQGQENIHVTADAVTGEFLVEFTWFDIRHDAGGAVFDHDNDGDSTRIHFTVWSPDDFDFDGFGNGVDNCPYVVNFGQEDADGDGTGDICDAVHFADIDGHWAVASIEAAYAHGITNGCATDPLLFCPDDDVTRAELTAFILRAMKEDGNLPAYQGLFPDVPPGKWYTGYVEKAAELELVKGYTDGNFGPNDQLNRAEMAVVVIRALDDSDPPIPATDPFNDVPKASWYGPYVARLRDLGITVGIGGNLYGPYDPITRAEVATMIERAWNLTTP